ncbi:MAG: hypothetical protein AAB209_08560, partial [Bacteroidota bacterium]
MHVDEVYGSPSHSSTTSFGHAGDGIQPRTGWRVRESCGASIGSFQQAGTCPEVNDSPSPLT